MISVVSTEAPVPVRSSARVPSTGMVVVAMSASVAVVEGWPAVIVIVVVIVQVDGEEPSSASPVYGMIEIVRCREEAPLPVVQDSSQVCIPIGQEVAVEVIVRVEPHQIVEVDLVSILILFVVEIQLVGHLVGQVQSLLSGLFVSHSIDVQQSCKHRNKSENVTSHNLVVFWFLLQSYVFFSCTLLGFPLFVLGISLQLGAEVEMGLKQLF